MSGRPKYPYKDKPGGTNTCSGLIVTIQIAPYKGTAKADHNIKHLLLPYVVRHCEVSGSMAGSGDCYRVIDAAYHLSTETLQKAFLEFAHAYKDAYGGPSK